MNSRSVYYSRLYGICEVWILHYEKKNILDLAHEKLVNILNRWTWSCAFKNMEALNCWILPSILLVYFSTMLSASSFSIPSSFRMTFNCSWRRYFLWTDLTLSSTSFPIFCCNLLNSYSFLSKPKAKYSLLGISFSDKTSTRSLVSPRNSN